MKQIFHLTLLIVFFISFGYFGLLNNETKASDNQSYDINKIKQVGLDKAKQEAKTLVENEETNKFLPIKFSDEIKINKLSDNEFQVYGRCYYHTIYKGIEYSGEYFWSSSVICRNDNIYHKGTSFSLICD